MQLGLQLGRADAHVRAAIATLDERDAAMATVRTAIDTLHQQVRADAALLVPSATSLFACICSRLDQVLSTADLSVTKRLISFALDCFSSPPLMATPKEADIKHLVLQLLDRLVDRRLSGFGDMASYLLKTINLLMLRLLQFAPREPTFCATLACLADKARRPSERQLSELLLKCLLKLAKTLPPVAPTIALPTLLERMHELRVAASPHTGPVALGALSAEALHTSEFASQLVTAADGLLRTLCEHRGAEVRAALPEGAAALLGPVVDQMVREASGEPAVGNLLDLSDPEPAACSVPALADAPQHAAPPPADKAASPTEDANAAAAEGVKIPSPELAPTTLHAAFAAAAPPVAEAATEAPVATDPVDLSDAFTAPAVSAAPAAPAAAEAAGEIAVATDSVAASALAKLHAMKKKYNIQTAPTLPAPPAAPPATTDEGSGAPAAPSRSSIGSSSSPAISRVQAADAAAPGSGGEGSKAISPSLNVAALRSRLARLKRQ